MRIVDLQPYGGWYVTTDQGEYRCNSSGNVWERLYGQSWEPEYNDEDELTKLFTAKMRS